MTRHLRVLIADDRSRSRDGLRALLITSPAVEVVAEATNGREAVNLTQEHRPDVVLMDALMPIMDGLEAARIIKREWPDTKVVMLTMYASYEIEALAAGVDGFLIKGFEAEELLRTILDR